MTALGFALVIIGGLLFAFVAIYYLVTYARTRQLYQRRKSVFFPLAAIGWLTFVTGALILYFHSKQ